MEIDVYKEWLGINEPGPFDHYTLLRLPKFEDDTEKIRNNYKKLNMHVRKYATGAYSVRSQDLLNELAKCMLCLTDPERKRDYDEGMGRVFEDDGNQARTIDRILIKQGHIDREQAKEVESFKDQSGLSFADAVVQMKLVDRETAVKARAEELGVAYVDLEDTPPQFTVLDKLPKQVCRRNTILPLHIDYNDNLLLVACADELSHELEEELRLRYNLPAKRVLATPQSINAGIDQYYGELKEALAAAAEAGEGAGSPSQSQQQGAPKKKPKAAAAGPAKNFSSLPPEEQQQRKQIGYIIMLWGIIIPVLLDQYVIKPAIPALSISFLPSLATLVITPSAILFVLKSYWK